MYFEWQDVAGSSTTCSRHSPGRAHASRQSAGDLQTGTQGLRDGDYWTQFSNQPGLYSQTDVEQRYNTSHRLELLHVVFSLDCVQVRCGLLPVQHPRQLLLVAGGGHVSTDPPGPDLRLSEEILLVVHHDWVG